MILLTGAAGKTGQAVLRALINKDVNVRVFVRTPEQSSYLKGLGTIDSIVGDLQDKSALQQAAQGCESIYYISPNVAPDEVLIGNSLLEAARNADVQCFVYHSVLHPHIESMPHHWQKMRMEERLFESGIDYTILQPCAYMQNILSNWKAIVEQGVYAIPYATSARLSIVDLEDVAEAAAIVLTENRHANAIYELAGPQPLSQDEVASVLSSILKIKVTAKAIERNNWAENARNSSLTDIQIETLLRMFEYYEKYGLVGNSNGLAQLLSRAATTFQNFVNRQIPFTKEIISGGNN